MVNRKNQQLSESSKNKTEGNAGWDRRQIQKVKLLNLNSRPFVKGQLKDLNRRIGKLSENRKNISGSHPINSEASFGFLKEFSKCLKRSSSFQELHNDMTHVLNVPALDVRSVGKFWLRGWSFRVQVRWMDCAPEAYASKRLMPCWGKLRPCVEITQTASW